jgi:hypothetical protein
MPDPELPQADHSLYNLQPSGHSHSLLRTVTHFLLSSFVIMRTFIPLSVFVLSVARAEWEIVPTPDKLSNLEIPRFVPEISEVEPKKSYVVKLDCLGCPMATRQSDTEVTWQSNEENALVRAVLTST